MIIRNASWNIAAGFSSAILTVALPPFLIRMMLPEEFGAWSICLQIAGYVNILNLGLQVIMAKWIATADARNDKALQNVITNTIVLILTAVSVVGFVLCLLLAQNIGVVVPHAKADLVPKMKTTIELLGASFCLLLPATAFGAVFNGLRQNGSNAIVTIGAKLLTFASVIMAAHYNSSIDFISLAWFLANSLGALAFLIFWKSRIAGSRLSLSYFSPSTAKAVLKDSVGLTTWNLSMLLVSGLQIVLVGRLDYAALSAFSIAATLSMFVAGVLQAVATVVVPQSAHLIEHGKYAELKDTLSNMTILTGAISALTTLILVIGADIIIKGWAGQNFVTNSSTMLIILALSSAVRNTMLIYAMVSVGAGLQHRMLLPAVGEGLISFTCSLIFGKFFGAFGVCSGMFAGAIFGVYFTVRQNIICAIIENFDMASFVKNDILRPNLFLIFVMAIFIFAHSKIHLDTTVVLGTLIFCLLGYLFYCWRNPNIVRAFKAIWASSFN